MSQEMLKLKIGETVYGMRKMPPKQGAFFAPKVSKLLAGIVNNSELVVLLRSLQDLANNQGDNTEVPVENMGTLVHAISSVLEQVDTEQLNAIFDQALSYGVYCNDKDLSDSFDFDTVFGINPSHYFPVAIWATYNHVSGFFVNLSAGVKALMTSWQK